MPSNISPSSLSIPLDVELPLPSAMAPDIDLSTMAVAQVLAPVAGDLFQPTLSQVAADPSRLRLRWPAGSRPGYHGDSSGNWMHDSRVGIGERTIGGV